MKKMIRCYLRERLGALLLFCGVLSIFFALTLLYRQPVEAFLYGAVLSCLLLLSYLLAGFVPYHKQHKALQTALASPESGWRELPPAQTLAEQDYHRIVDALGERCTELTGALHAQQQESLDYYTTWVHQIKTPIAVMRMILQSEDTQEHRELLDELFRIEQYVEMVLNYTRLGSESHDFVFQRCSLDSILRQSIRKYAPQFIRRRIRLIYTGTDAEVLTDEKWLSFLVEQILSNAVKYTVEGSVTISVSPQKVLTISDTGIGISPDDLPRVFEKGFTGYNGRADRKSTGLGLYLCKKTTDQLGHRIWMESGIGKGTTVYIDLAKKALVVE